MGRFFCCVLMFFLFSCPVQSQDLRKEMQTLVQRVDSLEHALSYRSLTYELKTLTDDIQMFISEIYIQSIEIRLNLYNRVLNTQLGDVYQQYYESCQSKKEAIYELVETKNIFFTLKIISDPYSESELNMLKVSCDVMNKAYESLEQSMGLLKTALDAYKEML